MTCTVVFETHSWSEDNERGLASGWLPGRLSETGRQLASELGRRRRGDGLAAVFTSDLRRAVETTEIAFNGTSLPMVHDWRLRECNYGEMNGAPAARVHADRLARIGEPYPGGESWEQAICRAAGCFRELGDRWGGRRVLVIGHVATRWALDCLAGRTLRELIDEPFAWREGWEYELRAGTDPVRALG